MSRRYEDNPVTPKKSAAILIIRDGTEDPHYGTLQVLMGHRHANTAFAGGAHVFPGGKLEKEDRILEDIQQGEAGQPSFAGRRYAAFREIFEETGLLLGTRDGQPISESLRQDLDAKFRPAFLNGEITLAAFLAATGITIAAEHYAPFSHWVTPHDRPIRFDTCFFLCAAPPDQNPEADGREIIAVDWYHPLKILTGGQNRLMRPTVMNLKKLGEAKSVAEAFERLALSGPDPSFPHKL